MHRLLLTCPLWLLFAVASTAQASVLGDLGYSLLEGPVSIQSDAAHRVLPISEQARDRRLDPSALDDSAALRRSDGSGPEIFLMPYGQGSDAGMGMGIRFAF